MAKFVEIKAVANYKKGLFQIFLDFYDIKTRLDHLEAFGTFTYARNASGAQRCE